MLAAKRICGYLRDLTFSKLSAKNILDNLAEISEHNPRVQRWLGFLAAYTYTLHYKKGASDGTANMLSRLPLLPTDMDVHCQRRITTPDDVGIYLSR